MRSTSARRFPSVFHRLALSNLATQSAEQIGLAAAPIGAGTGSAIMALADPLGATGTVLNLPEGAGTTTVESKTNFTAPAPVGTRAIGECPPMHRDKRTMIWQTRISTPGGRLVALVTQTQLAI